MRSEGGGREEIIRRSGKRKIRREAAEGRRAEKGGSRRERKRSKGLYTGNGECKKNYQKIE